MAFDRKPGGAPEHLDVIVVGAGLSGIDAAYRLQTECPGHSFAVLEARHAIGGTWDLFRYPGIRSDSDMSTLGFPFEPWDSEVTIAEGGEIRGYIEHTAKKYGIDRKIRFGHRVTAADWDSRAARWTLSCQTPAGSVQLSCNFLHVCSGYYDYAAGYTPDFPGRADYRGTFVHPQHWPEDLAVAGKRVVVIGSGATAMTLAPALAAQGAEVTMLQRSPTYVVTLPRLDRIAAGLRRFLPARAAGALVRWKNILLSIGIYAYSRAKPARTRARILDFARRQLAPGYDVERHFGPSYKPWDQRLCVVPNGDLFRAIRKGRVSMVTDHIDRLTPDGIRTASGRVLPADIVVSATGLSIQLFGGAQVRVDGVPVQTAERMIYKGMMMDGVPNLAFAFGYTNASWTLKCDLTARYACRLLRHMRRGGYDVCVARRSAEIAPEPMVDLASGYIQRARAVMPQQGSRAPWRVHQNYLRDLAATTFDRLDDGVVSFERRSDVPAPVAQSA